MNLTRVRADERRETLTATFTVFVVLVAHALLETARDALFLTHLPAERLPWMYLTLAVLGLVLAQVYSLSAARSDARRSLLLAQLVAAGGTAAFWLLTAPSRPLVYYALYLWAGVASMSILVMFWLHLAERFTTTQAKRLFPVVGAGSVAGVLAGFALSAVLVERFATESLLLASALVFLAGAVGTVVLGQRREESDRAGARPQPGLSESMSSAARHPYVRRLALVLLLSSVTLTLVDFVFKSVVAGTVASADLGPFFARVYLLFNFLSLLALMALAPLLVRGAGVIGTLAALPIVLMVGGLGLMLVGGFVVTLCLKGVDGTLRWSTHKTATELLYVPMPSELRAMVKSVIDVVMYRGGQAIGSLAILAGLALTDDLRGFGAAIAACSALWCYVALTSRETYLNLFRENLSQVGAETRLEFPELSVGSLETLIAALSSADDKQVLAAIDLLAQKGRARLVPPLILYHPSPQVVVRALDLFAETRRSDFLPMVPRILDHEYAEVRAATLRAISAVRPDPQVLRQALDHHCPVVNVTAIVGLAVGGWKPIDEAVNELMHHAEHASELARPMIARAIRYRPRPEFAPVLIRLAQTHEIDTQREAVRAMRSARDPRFVPSLIPLLAERALREDVRQALLELGQPALSALAAALRDLTAPFAIRVHLPRTISRFQGEEAAGILVRQLLEEPRGMVRYKILRGLGRLIANDPFIRLDPETLDEVLRRTVASCFRTMHWGLVLENGAREQPQRRTASHELLVQLLRDKQRHSTERLFRTLGLRFHSEDIARIYDGLNNPNPALRSSSRELLDGLLPNSLGRAVLALIDDDQAEEMLKAGEEYYQPEDLDYPQLLEVLATQSGATLPSIANYHAAELGLRPSGATPGLAVDGEAETGTDAQDVPAEVRAAGGSRGT